MAKHGAIVSDLLLLIAYIGTVKGTIVLEKPQSHVSH